MKAEIATIDSACSGNIYPLYMGKPLQLLSQHAVEPCSLHTGKATNLCRKLVLGSCSWWSKNEIANMGANVKTVLSHELAQAPSGTPMKIHKMVSGSM